ncbi:MAG: polysaccharide biosynthesis protein [Flavobacteriales bacterium]
MLLNRAHTPRWMIFAADVLICTFAYAFAYLLRFEFNPPASEVSIGLAFFPIFIGVRALSFLFGRTYAGIIRYTSSQDTLRIFSVLTIGTVVMAAANLGWKATGNKLYLLPNSILLIEYLASLFALIAMRIGVKMLYLELKTPAKAKTRAAIFGAGESGIITKRAVEQEVRRGIEVVAFLDDNREKGGKKLEGVSIYPSEKMDELFASGKVDQLIISIQNIAPTRKAEVIEAALKHRIQVMNVPPFKQWIGGDLTLKQLREIRIEDLLGRPRIQLDSSDVRSQVVGKVVLVTGAAGSIGSELCRQLLAYSPAKLIALDQAETPLFELDRELLRAKGEVDYEPVVADIRSAERLGHVFETFQPQLVYHAAAYKHVPLMEVNPSEAVNTNVLGTRNLVQLAVNHDVERFVQVSTDKAVNPTSVMGATKRVAEMVAQVGGGNTKFITTRFGNVLGSNGSVIPIFRKQIAAGGPLTVTHPEVTRFFMTIPEAVQLVLEAGAMGDGGEIFVFDMGESIKIVDLARNMIQLSGLEEGRDIEVKFTGLRPGEKLYEELLNTAENTLPTHHPKILRARIRPTEKGQVDAKVAELLALFAAQNNTALVRQLKSIVPEYVSNNSDFEALDSPGSSPA